MYDRVKTFFSYVNIFSYSSPFSMSCISSMLDLCFHFCTADKISYIKIKVNILFLWKRSRLLYTAYTVLKLFYWNFSKSLLHLHSTLFMRSFWINRNRQLQILTLKQKLCFTLTDCSLLDSPFTGFHSFDLSANCSYKNSIRQMTNAVAFMSANVCCTIYTTKRVICYVILQVSDY